MEYAGAIYLQRSVHFCFKFDEYYLLLILAVVYSSDQMEAYGVFPGEIVVEHEVGAVGAGVVGHAPATQFTNLAPGT